MKIKNLKAYKSTILGTILIGVGLYLVITGHKESIDYNEYFAAGLLASGVLLLFAPDKFINRLECIIFDREISIGKRNADKEGHQ